MNSDVRGFSLHPTASKSNCSPLKHLVQWANSPRLRTARAALRLFLLWSAVSGLACLVALTALNGASVKLAWEANLEPDLVGYKLYYGTASHNYTSTNLVGTNFVGNEVTTTVSNLIAGTTYFFVVTAYNTAGLESDPSSEVTTNFPPLTSGTTGAIPPANRPPVLSPISDQSGFVQVAIVTRIVATDPDLPPNHLLFSLDPGAPPGARIGKATGVFTWLPTRQQARSTNLVTVRVTDDGSPPLFATQTFTVTIGDYLELYLGTNIVLAGGTGCVSVAVHSTTPVTRMTFQVDAPGSGLTDLNLKPEVQLFSAALQTKGPARFEVSLQALEGQPFFGTQTLASICFRAAFDTPSAFLPLRVSKLSAGQPGAVPAARVLGNDGRVVLIKSTPLLEVVQSEAQNRLYLYAPLGPIVTVQWAPRLTPQVAWRPMWSGHVTNLVQVFSPLPDRNSFYRTIVP
jgi:hypothetical protein